MSEAERDFLRCCQEPQLGEAVAKMPDRLLREMIRFLRTKPPTGIPGLVLGLAEATATNRFLELNTP